MCLFHLAQGYTSELVFVKLMKPSSSNMKIDVSAQCWHVLGVVCAGMPLPNENEQQQLWDILYCKVVIRLSLNLNICKANITGC